jgi:hypothetical protein
MAGVMRILIVALFALLIASPAEAGPVVGAIQAVAAALQAFAAKSLFASFLVRTGLSIGFSLLAQAVRGKPRAQGISADTTTTGGTTPWTFGVGLFATGGQLIAPPNSYGSVGDTPRAYLVYPLALSVVPGCALNRLIVNDAYVPLAASPSANWGRAATGDLAGFVQIDYFDGSQTAAQPDLLAAFGSDPDRPWSADMVGPGTCMAYARFRYSRRRFNGLPTVRFEMLGIPLYDPRADSTVGGSGPQRWNDRATWAFTANNFVIIYNIKRGIDVGAGLIWGGETEAEDLPLADWFAAMNECDVAVDNGAGGTEPQYRCGMQISVDDEPAAVIEELLKACSGQLVEIGGVWYPHCGPPALPSYFLTDEDILITAEQSFDPHPGLADTYNGITAAYPEPEGLWEAKDAPPRYNEDWEAEDGGRRLVADVELRACPWAGQVQRIMDQIIADHRRMRRHQFVLPPEAVTLRPFQTVGWTSARHGYTAKVFEITGVTDQLMTLNQGLSLRERDSGDFAWNPATDLIPVAPAAPVTTPIPAQTLPGWGVTAGAIEDASSTARRPTVIPVWTAGGVEDARGIRIAIRLAGDTGDGREFPIQDATEGRAELSDGVLSLTDYELRGKPVVDRDTDWTAWTPVTTLDVRASLADLQADLASHLTALGDWIGAGIDLPADLGGQAATLREYLDQLRTLTAEGAESAARSMIAEMRVRDYIGSAEIRLGTRISVTDEQVAIIAAAVTTLQAQIPGLASVTAFNALVATVAVNGDDITAIGDSLTALSATVGLFSATGLLRVTVEATPAGALSRIGLKAAATGAEANSLREAALYLEAIAGDTSQVIIKANRFAVENGTDRVFPLIISGGQVYLQNVLVEGMAIFGGVLQSDDFVAGTAGWMIDEDGGAEFNDLVVRSWLQAGAVSDTWQAVQAGPISGNVTNGSLTLDIGAISRGSLLRRGVVFEAQKSGAGVFITIEFQRRSAQLGGAFGAWTTLTTWDQDDFSATWDVYSAGGNLNGYHDDFEYRLLWNSTGISAGVQWLRNIYITVADVKK